MESNDKCILGIVISVIIAASIISITWFVVEYKTTKIAMQSNYNQVLNIGQSGYHWEKEVTK